MIRKWVTAATNGALLSIVFAYLALAQTCEVGSTRILNSCLANLGVRTMTASSSGYGDASLAFNRRFSYKPAAIVYPKTKDEVSLVVKCAAAAKAPVVARSGGHSYAAYGLGGQDGALVVDLSSMKSISVDQSSGLAVSQTGNRLGDLAQYIWDNGRRALPHGTCPYVGTGGHAAYGGFGLYGRTAGLLLDRVVSAEVVIANGSVVTASAQSNSDLFWAIRGAAPSYGIVTAWTFNTLPAPANLVNYWYTFSSSLSNTQAVQIIQAFMNFAASKPTKQLQCVANIGVSNGRVYVSIMGTFYGSQADFNTAIGPLQSSFPGDVGMSLRTTNRDWYGGLTEFTGSLNTGGPDDYDNFFAKSLFSSTAYSQAAITNWVNYMTQQGNSAPVMWWVLIDMYGGSVSDVAEDATAYAHRSAVLNFQIYGYSSNDGHNAWVGQSGIDFINGLTSSLDPNPSAAYPNYIDPTLTAAQWQSLYFGGHMDRLKQLKAAWDPNNVFRFPQSIPLPS
ncbi:hypothetical protein FRC00_012801 [Tulasnella sp. 408]|nr:hypothetical protein FRC00_012801 [Tulasnella sp. 408]